VGDYVIRHAYSNGADLAFQAGQQVELDDATAAWLEHDSPGIISGAKPKAEKPDEPSAEEPKPRARRAAKD